MKRLRFGMVLAVVMALAWPSAALVWYDRGRLNIDGVELFEDVDSPGTYYYLPPAPSLALNDDGTPQLLCVKYIDPSGESSGGILHFLATLDLSAERVAELEEMLNERAPGATLAGPLPLLESRGGKEGKSASFQLVSAVLKDTEEGGLTRTVITSGHAPVTPGSRAAVAAHLDPHGATLLWDTFEGSTSDVSVALAAEYEAKVRGYNATVSASVETVYEHFSQVLNKQEGYKRRQLRDIVDELYHDNVLSIEVFDRSESLGIDASALQRILDLVTEKLVQLMFDHQTGLAKMPEQEVAVEQGQIKGRQKKGFLARAFTSTGNQKYFTDNQFVLKSRRDVRRTTFALNLSRDSTVRMPVYLAGNMGGLYSGWREDTEVFRVVNLADPAFAVREVRFVLDGDWAARFSDILNWVSVQLRKTYGDDQPEVDDQVQLSAADVSKGVLDRTIRYPRLGDAGESWLSYRYRVHWSLLRHGEVAQPEGDLWAESAEPVITLRPPLEVSAAELEVDRELMRDRGFRAVVVEVRARMMGEDDARRAAVLRADDPEPVVRLQAVHDPGTVPQCRLTWIPERGGSRRPGDWIDMEFGYLWVEAPEEGTVEP